MLSVREPTLKFFNQNTFLFLALSVCCKSCISLASLVSPSHLRINKLHQNFIGPVSHKQLPGKSPLLLSVNGNIADHGYDVEENKI